MHWLSGELPQKVLEHGNMQVGGGQINTAVGQGGGCKDGGMDDRQSARGRAAVGWPSGQRPGHEDGQLQGEAGNNVANQQVRIEQAQREQCISTCGDVRMDSGADSGLKPPPHTACGLRLASGMGDTLGRHASEPNTAACVAVGQEYAVWTACGHGAMEGCVAVGSMHYGSGLEPLSNASCGPWRVSETDDVLPGMQCKQGYRTAVSACHFVGIRVDNLNGHGVIDGYVKFGALTNTHPCGYTHTQPYGHIHTQGLSGQLPRDASVERLSSDRTQNRQEAKVAGALTSTHGW